MSLFPLAIAFTLWSSPLGAWKYHVVAACGSRSTTRVRREARAESAARLTAVAVLPTPPLMLNTAMISRPIPAKLHR